MQNQSKGVLDLAGHFFLENFGAESQCYVGPERYEK